MWNPRKRGSDRLKPYWALNVGEASPPSGGEPHVPSAFDSRGRSIPASEKRTPGTAHGGCRCPKHPRKRGADDMSLLLESAAREASPQAGARPCKCSKTLDFSGSIPAIGAEGAEQDGRFFAHPVRSIPASGGQTWSCACTAKPRKKHHRKRGPDLVSINSGRPRVEASPQTGRVVDGVVGYYLRRIPASGGQTRATRRLLFGWRKHPRKRGRFTDLWPMLARTEASPHAGVDWPDHELHTSALKHPRKRKQGTPADCHAQLPQLYPSDGPPSVLIVEFNRQRNQSSARHARAIHGQGVHPSFIDVNARTRRMIVKPWTSADDIPVAAALSSMALKYAAKA